MNSEAPKFRRVQRKDGSNERPDWMAKSRWEGKERPHTVWLNEDVWLSLKRIQDETRKPGKGRGNRGKKMVKTVTMKDLVTVAIRNFVLEYENKQLEEKFEDKEKMEEHRRRKEGFYNKKLDAF